MRKRRARKCLLTTTLAMGQTIFNSKMTKMPRAPTNRSTLTLMVWRFARCSTALTRGTTLKTQAAKTSETRTGKFPMAATASTAVAPMAVKSST